MTGQLRLVAC